MSQMFNVDSLDDIESASLVSSHEVKGLGALGALDVAESEDFADRPAGLSASLGDETLNRVNKDISSIESKLTILFKKLNILKEKAEEDRKVAAALHRMMTENLQKIMKIKETFEDSKDKLRKNDMNIRELERMIKELQQMKIEDLELLQDFADNQKSRALFSISKKASMSDDESDSIESALKSLSDSLFSSDEGEDDTEGESGDSEEGISSIAKSNNIDQIDTNAHNIFPLKKIKSMKKIKSLTVRNDLKYCT